MDADLAIEVRPDDGPELDAKMAAIFRLIRVDQLVTRNSRRWIDSDFTARMTYCMTGTAVRAISGNFRLFSRVEARCPIFLSTP